MRAKSLLLSMLLIMNSSHAFAESNKANDERKGLNLDWIDTKATPNQDFFTYANGTWQKNNPIPPEYASWNSFYVLQENVLDFIHNMLIGLAADKSLKAGSIEKKAGDFYYSGMDEASINMQGITPLQPLFNQIANLSNINQLPELFGNLQLAGVDALFGFGSMQDFANSKEMIGAAMQSGLGLPDRDYYLKDDANFVKIRAAYLDHIARMFMLAGDSKAEAEKEAKTVMAIETTLAKASMTRIEQRDPHAIYHVMSLDEIQKITPNFKWVNYFTTIGVPELTHINLAMPEFFKVMNQQLTQVSLDDWKTYLRWHVLDAFAPYLSTPFVEQNFVMNATLTGTKKLQPRWKRVVNTESAALGFAIGKLYVEKKFSPAARQEVLDILHNIRNTLRDDLKTLSWMTPATRQEALRKLDMIEERVGYPDKWWDYSSLQVDRGPYVLNVMHANEFLSKRDLAKIGKPVDRSEWAITPQTINAYYDPSMNNINIPAGILQPPFFDPAAPAAVNYGGIGFVIGHEITHGFDDQGAQFDGHGNLKNWWTKEDLLKFQAATHCIAQQFSNYKINNNMSVQGKLVVGEATADLGGLGLAYRAFHASKEFKEAKTVDGFTPDQQFFLGFAHVWAGNIRPEEALNRITTDPHPPMSLRVNGTLANMPQYHEAFSILQPGPMRNKIPCVIW